MVIKKGEDSLPTKIMKLVNFEQFGLTFSYVTECVALGFLDIFCSSMVL